MKRKKLPPVRQCQIDPYRQLSPQLRREATAILNALRVPTKRSLKLPIGKAAVVGIALQAAETQALRVPRPYVFVWGQGDA